jgi:endoglycosylceramidase
LTQAGKSRIYTFAVVAILDAILILQVWGAFAAAQTPTSEPTGFLKAQGRWIVDESGNIVLLRGVNFFGYEFGLWSSHTEAGYARIASWGFNVVRLPLAWSYIEPKAGKYDDNYFRLHVDKDIEWAKEYGLYVILDMHQYAWSPRFTYIHTAAGLPIWSQSGYPNSAEGEARAKADFWNGVGPNGSPSSSANPSMQERFIAMWKYVATRYANETTVAGYDIFNEPDVTRCSSDNKICYLQYPQFSQTVIAFLERVVDAVRQVDSHHMFLWETASWEFDPGILAVNRTDVVYSPHYPGGGTGNTIFLYKDKARLEASVKAMMDLSQKWNQPVFLGEWGITFDAPNATDYIDDLASLTDANLVGWAWWAYGSTDGFGMYLLDINGNPHRVFTETLIRPYVRTSSNGGLLSSSLDTNTRKFTIYLTGPVTLQICVPVGYSVLTVTADRGTPSWNTFSDALSVSVNGAASQLSVAFG